MIEIRQPHPNEAAACRMMLPETHLDPQGRQFRLAVDASHGDGEQIAGAISFRDDGRSISGVRLHVIAPRRREGIATRLLDSAIAFAHAQGRSKLIAGADVLNEPDAEAFLTVRGFSSVSCLRVVEGQFEELRASCATARQKIPAGEELPASAHFVGIADAPMDQLIALYAEHIAHMPNVPGMRRSLKLERYQNSVILMIEGKIIGAALGAIDGDTLHVPAWIVAPEYRGRHIGTLLRFELVNRVIDRVRRVRFEYLDRAPATAKLRRNAGYDILRMLVRFELTLPAT